MKLENFEDWFAIRSRHRDDDHWPARLIFDLDKGIRLTTARFIDNASSQEEPTFNTQTITGWLDYQRPTTLIYPQIRAIGGFTMSIDTPAMRASYQLTISAVLKNVFIENISEPIFNGLIVEHPAVHAWVNPSLVDSGWSQIGDANLPSLFVDVAPPKQRTFKLQNGTEAVVASATRLRRSEGTSLGEHTSLSLRFSQPVDYNAINRLIWRISTLFEFMIGARTPAPIYQLPTTQTRMWNDEEREVVAELWYQPSKNRKRESDIPSPSQRFTIEKHSSISLEALLNCIIGDKDELIYLADIIQRVENLDLPLTQGYGELIGCLEDFDARQFGSGSDPSYKYGIQSLERVIQRHGSDADRVMFEQLRSGIRNSYSLLQRLERLHEFWREDSFRGAPNFRRIRDLRNLLPHGQGLKVSSEVGQEMATYLSYLSALGRYHVLRALGFSGDEIATAFMRALRYGHFIPEHMIPKRR